MYKKTLLAASAVIIGLLCLTFAFSTEVKADETYVVTDSQFGAVADDNKDDQPAIQSALDKAASTDAHVIVEIPAGKYYLGKSLIVHSNTTIKAEGAEIESTNGAFTDLLYAIEEKDIEIIGGTWDLNSKPTANTQIFVLRRCDNINIEGVTLRRATNHILNISASKNVTVTNCTFEDPVRYTGNKSDYWEAKEFYDDFTFIEAIHTDYAGEGEASLAKKDGRTCSDVTIDKCTFRNVYSGVGNHHRTTTSRATNINVTNCYFENILYTCFNGICFDEYVFSGNKCKNVYNMIVSDDCTNSTIAGNELLLQDVSAGNKLGIPTIDILNSSDITIDNNKLVPLTWESIMLSGSDNITVSRNEIPEPASDYSSVDKVAIKLDRCNNCTVDNNTVTKAVNRAIHVYRGEGNIVSNNNVYYTKTNAPIFIDEGKNHKVENNTIVNDTVFCINVYSSENAIVAGNTIKDSAVESGIYSEKSTVTIKNNIISSNIKNNGIWTNDCSSAVISGNTLGETGNCGIYVLRCGSSDINHNTVSGTIEVGISVYFSTDSKLADNDIQSASDKGIELWEAYNCTLSGNTYGAAGFKPGSKSSYTVIDNPTTGWVKKAGIWYYYDSNGTMVTGWQKISGIWYYFNGSGAMQTGWQKIGGVWYYFNGGGAMQTGWQKIGGVWYYFNGSGAMQTGWKTIGGKQYYFKSSGAMAANEWVSGFWWLGSSGAWTYTAKGSWHQDSRGWWFGDSTGWYAKNETVVINNVAYTFDGSGYLK